MDIEQAIEKYGGLNRYIATRMRNNPDITGMDIDDLIQYGNLGIWEACEKYDESKNTKFDTYVSSKIRQRIIDGIRENSWVNRAGNGVKPIFGGINPNYLDAHSGKGDGTYEAMVLKLELKDTLSKLRPTDKVLIKRYYLSGDTQPEIAKDLGWHESTVYLRVQEALDELKKAFFDSTYVNNRVLTPRKVRKIKRLYAKYGISQYKLAKDFNTSQSQISNIINGNRWKDVDKHNFSGSTHAQKLTAKKVREIRRLNALTGEKKVGINKLVKMYGVNRNTIRKILQRKIWKHV